LNLNIASLLWSAGHWRDIVPSAQTERRGGAGPVGGLLGGKDPTGRFSAFARSIVVQDRADAATLGEQRVAAAAEQIHIERLVALLLAVALDFDGDGLGRLAGGEGQRAGTGDVVVVAGRRGAVGAAEGHRHGLVVGNRERDGESELRRMVLPALVLSHVGDADA